METFDEVLYENGRNFFFKLRKNGYNFDELTNWEFNYSTPKAFENGFFDEVRNFKDQHSPSSLDD